MGIAELSSFIRQNNEPILSEWDAVARALPHGSSMDGTGLRDHAAAMLDEIAADVEAPHADLEHTDIPNCSRSDIGRRRSVAIVAAEHGHHRAGNGFTVIDMMAEFRALRATVTRLWIAQSSQFGRAELEALIRFNEAIDETIAHSLDRYVRDIDETRRQVLAILSHDLRNPLAAIGAAGSFLAETSDMDPDTARLVSIIRTAATRMTHLVADMLELALNRVGDSMPIERGVMDAGQLVDAVVAEVRASYANVKIEVDADGNLIGYWDAARLAQALTNVIGNAVQHGNADEPIHVSARGDESQVDIEVRSRGPRIPTAQLHRIFDGAIPPTHTTADRRHLGLGLFIVTKIVEAHGGSIAVRSANTETSFTIHLPRAA